MAVDDIITAGAHDNSNDGSTPGGGGEADRLGPGIWKITAVVVAGTFMAQLSTTVANVSLSSLGAELHASLSAIQWVTSGYLQAQALMLPQHGLLVVRWGRLEGVQCSAAFRLPPSKIGWVKPAATLHTGPDGLNRLLPFNDVGLTAAESVMDG